MLAGCWECSEISSNWKLFNVAEFSESDYHYCLNNKDLIHDSKKSNMLISVSSL